MSWVCYMLWSIDSNKTYIGSSNNQLKRLIDHNNRMPSRAGAKITAGQSWLTYIVVSGFESKIAALSFEAGWKRLAKTRSNKRLVIPSIQINTKLTYDNTRQSRIYDLLWFTTNFTYMNGKFKLNVMQNHPTFIPSHLIINVHSFDYDWINIMPWPYFISVIDII